ncbi:MAG: hypothetical protein DME45_08575 [Verrucomicrobia bacterium]|nr:MAG: hypothetical protein DME45_08575 [Verrucomicrobiota bacterium]
MVGKSVAIICGVFLLGAHLSAHAAVLTVTNTADAGAGSLRQAMLDSNSSAGVLDTITFNIPGAGVRTIIPLTVLPTITDPVVIDGYSQPGSSANTIAVGDNSVHLIELNGNSAVCGALVISAGNSTVRGLVINRFNGNCGNTAILLQTGGNNTVEGCFLGLNAAGTAASTNRDFGVRIENSPNNIIGGTTPAERNVISGNNIGIQINGPASSGTTIQGNYIGTNAAGTAALVSGGVSQSVIGVAIGNNGGGTGSSNNTIGGTTAAARNVISGNASDNIKLFDDTITGNKIQGNYIGTNAAGTAGLGFGTGIDFLRTNDTLIGGTVTGAGNVISGNSAYGINLDGSRNLIQGNFIGTDATGTAKVPNGALGILIVADGFNAESNNTIGGITPAARNIISGSGSHGIRFELQASTTGNLIEGNYIGTDISGMTDLGNSGSGIQIFASVEPTGGVNTVGGTSATARNIISGNSGDGISGASPKVLIQGNYIGTDVNGTGNLGNAGFGIDLQCIDNNTIGGAAAGAGNVIAFNGLDGVRVVSCSSGGVVSGLNNSILGNSIFSNTRLGINLLGGTENAVGVTPNDPGDADTGANDLQNFPVLETVSSSGGMTNITGRVNSAASTTYRIEFFANDVIDPSSYGEGQIFLGFKNVTTSASGNANFTAMVPQVAAGQRVTSTATDPNGNTSEFSGAIGQLLNVSTRMEVLTGGSVLIGGFIIGGTGNKDVLLRALGPTLQSFGITGFLADPTLELRDVAGALIMSNDNWKDTQQAAISATGKAPPNDLEPAILHTFAPGNYTGIVRGKNNTTGIGLIEAYDLDQSPATTLTNISTRGFVDVGQNAMIGGFISGNGIVRVIVRALGPTLTQFGVPNVLADPILDVRDAQGNSLATNDNWADTQQAEIQASGKAPPDTKESAIIIVRPAGNTTAIVTGKNNTTGNALVEAYILTP